MRMRPLVKPFGSLVLFTFLAACGGGDADAPPADDTAPIGGAAPAPGATTPPATPGAAPAAGGDLVAQGQQVYNGAGICMTCHGPNGQGTVLAPNLADDTWIWSDGSQPLEPQLVEIIRTGVPQPREHPAPMPPMGGASLTDDQLNAVAAYVASL